jgi:RNA polymerase sigma-70 factor (ECF subfamily)
VLEQAEASETRAFVRRVLDRLPERYRNVLVLYELLEYSGPEIEQLTGIKQATVWVMVHRARALFLKEMKALQAKGAKR